MIDGAGAAGATSGTDFVPEPASDSEVSYRAMDARQNQPVDRDDEGEAPKLHVDNSRANIAAKFNRNRANHRGRTVPRSHVPAIDGDEPAGDVDDPNHPDHIASDGARSATEEAEDRQTGQTRAAAGEHDAPNGGGPRSFTLTVFGNSIHVRDRAELARYADVDEDEADSIPDAALIKLAQKQVAAQQRLDEAKEFGKRARATGAVSPATPADDDDPSDQPEPQPTSSQRRKPAASTLNLVDKLMYGDREEAALEVENLLAQAVPQHIERQNTARTVDQIRREVHESMSSIGQANADIANNPDAKDLIAVKTTRAIVDELRNVGITDAEATQLLQNPKLAADAFVGAHSIPEYQGRLRKFDVVAGEAVAATRRTLGLKPVALTQQTSATTDGPQTRRDMKRTLPQQPARAGAPLPTDLPMERTDDRRARSSDAIAKMRASRHQ